MLPIFDEISPSLATGVPVDNLLKVTDTSLDQGGGGTKSHPPRVSHYPVQAGTLLEPTAATRVATWNVNRLTDPKLLAICGAFVQNKLDILVLIDTRTPKALKPYYTNQFKNALSQDCRVIYNPAEYFTQKGSPRELVGGTITIVGRRWAKHITDVWTDPTECGVVSSVTLRGPTRSLTVIATYWPAQKKASKGIFSLWYKVQTYLLKVKSRLSPMDFIRELIDQRMLKALQREEATTVTLVGDFNGGWNGKGGTHTDLQAWAEKAQWSNQTYDICNSPTHHQFTTSPPPATYYEGPTPVSWIDHILTTSSEAWQSLWEENVNQTDGYGSVQRAGRVIGGEAIVFDHCMLWADIVAGQSGSVAPPAKPPPPFRTLELNLEKKQDVETFRATMASKIVTRNWLKPVTLNDAINLLDDIEISITSVLCSLSRKARASPKNWSPMANALMTAYRFVTRMGEVGRRMTPEVAITATLYHLESLGKECIENVHRIHEKASKNSDKVDWTPDQVLSHVPVHLFSFYRGSTYKSLSEDLARHSRWGKRRLLNQLHTRHLKETRLKVNAVIRERNEAVARGKCKRVIEAVTESSRQQFTMRFIETDTEIEVEPRVIHRRYTIYYTEWFEIPLCMANDILQRPGAKWRHIFRTRQAFIREMRKTKIPIKYLYFLYDAVVYNDLYDKAGTKLKHQPDDPSPKGKATISEVMKPKIANAMDPSNPPTVEEVQRCIDNAATDKSAGPDRVTYNTLKALPTEVIALLHSAIALVWRDRKVPEAWKVRWLCPIGKKPGATTIENTRPIMLMGVIRKIFQAIIVKRLAPIWTECGAFSQQAHGGLKGRGTDSANLELVNLIEEIEETESTMYTTSWDLRRAFDGISESLKLWILAQLGLPQEAAEFMESIDATNITIVRTPYAAENYLKKEWYDHRRKCYVSKPPAWQNRSKKGTRSKANALSVFRAQRGVSQGGPISAIHFIGGNNIQSRLLEVMMAHYCRKSFMTRTRSLTLSDALPLSYLDDTQAQGPTISIFQRIVDMLCVFIIFAGYELSIEKLRTFAIAMGIDISPNRDITIYIHTRGWVATPLVWRSDTTLQYIGVTHDLDPFGKTQQTNFKVVKNCAASIARLIRTKGGSPSTMCTIVQLSTIPKLTYRLTHSSLPLQRIDEIQVILNVLFRQILKRMRTFPTALLYMPRMQHGLGLVSLTDRVHTRKGGMFIQALGGMPVTKGAAEGVVERSFRRNLTPIEGDSYNADTFPWITRRKRTLWFHSLQEWLGRQKLMVVRGGKAIEPWNQTIDVLMWGGARNLTYELRTFEIDFLRTAGLHTLGDLVQEEEGVVTLIPLHLIAFKFTYYHPRDGNKSHVISAAFVENYLPHPLPMGNRVISPTQFWALHTARVKGIGRDVFQILGVDSSRLMVTVRVWGFVSDKDRLGDRRRKSRPLDLPPHKARVRLRTPLRGAGSDTEIPWKDLFVSPTKWARVLLGPVKHRKLPTGKTCRERIVLYSHWTDVAPVLPSDSTIELSRPLHSISTAVEAIRENPDDEWEAYTDGSFSPTTNRVAELVGVKTVENNTSGAAIVFIKPSDDWRASKIITVQIPRTTGWRIDSVFPFEMVAIVLAQYIAAQVPNRVEILSDSEASIGALTQWDTGKQAKLRAGLFFQQISLSLKKRQVIKLSHVKAHAERTNEDCSTWTRQMWGNVLADRLAGGDRSPHHLLLHTGTTTSAIAPFGRILETLQELTTYYIAHTDVGMRNNHIATMTGQDSNSIFPLLRDLRKHASQSWCQRYTQNRMESTLQDVDWPSISGLIGHAAYKLSKASPSCIARWSALTYRHFEYGERTRRLYSDRSGSGRIDYCSFCGGHDEVDHLALRCPATCQERTNTYSTMRAIVDKWIAKNPDVGDFVHAAYMLATHGRGGTIPFQIWTGAWDNNALEDLWRYLEEALVNTTDITTKPNDHKRALVELTVPMMALVDETHKRRVTAIARLYNSNAKASRVVHPDDTPQPRGGQIRAHKSEHDNRTLQLQQEIMLYHTFIPAPAITTRNDRELNPPTRPLPPTTLNLRQAFTNPKKINSTRAQPPPPIPPPPPPLPPQPPPPPPLPLQPSPPRVQMSLYETIRHTVQLASKKSPLQPTPRPRKTKPDPLQPTIPDAWSQPTKTLTLESENPTPVQRTTLQRPSDLHTPRTNLHQFRPLTLLEEQIIATTLTPQLHDPGAQDSCHVKFNITLRYTDIRRLAENRRESSFLSDTGIYLYLRFIESRNEDCLGMDPLFISRLWDPSDVGVNRVTSYDYNKVSSSGWTRNQNVFSYKNVFIPININMRHWTMIHLEPQKRRINYLDSIGGARQTYSNQILQWLDDCAMDSDSVSYNPQFDRRQWTMETKLCPRQGDWTSCGVCVCMNADLLAHSIPLNYTTDDISYFRKKMCMDFIRGDLDYPYNGVEILRTTDIPPLPPTPTPAPSNINHQVATTNDGIVPTFVRTEEGTIFSICQVPEDGNCMFFAIARLQDTIDGHADQRSAVCDHLLKFSTRYDMKDAMGEPTFKRQAGPNAVTSDYIDYMRGNGRYGTDLELQVLADILKVQIIVYKVMHDQRHDDIPTVEVVGRFTGSDSTTTPKIYHLHWRKTDNGAWHYEDMYEQAPRPARDRAIPPPPPPVKRCPATLTKPPPRSFPLNHRTYYPSVWCRTDGILFATTNHHHNDSLFGAIAMQTTPHYTRESLRLAVCSTMETLAADLTAPTNTNTTQPLSDTTNIHHKRAQLLRQHAIAGDSGEIKYIAHITGRSVIQYVLNGDLHRNNIPIVIIHQIHYPHVYQLDNPPPIRILWRTTPMGLRHYEPLQKTTEDTVKVSGETVSRGGP